MTTDERIDKLERELSRARRRNRFALAVAALAVVGLGLAWALMNSTQTAQAQERGNRTIRANRFILDDEDGKIRTGLGVDKDDGPGIRLYNEEGNIVWSDPL